MPFQMNPENTKLFLEVRQGLAKVLSLDVHELRSAWMAK
jgi:hypothetical protein